MQGFVTVARLGRLLVVALLSAMAAAPSAAANPFTEAGRPITFGTSFDVPSAALGQTRRVNVLLPNGYDDPKLAGKRYPVLYLLDGGTGWQDFFHIAGLVQQGGTWGANAPMIVIGIESGDRKAEFTNPSTDPKERKDFPTHGQAETFRRFLVEELRPAVEGAFRADGITGLIGESLAGLFVVDVALRHGGDFDRYIAVSPSLWWDQGRLPRDADALLSANPQAKRTIWLSMANEGSTMLAGMDRLVTALKARGGRELDWRYTPYPAETHGTIYHPAATRAIRQVFPPSSPGK